MAFEIYFINLQSLTTLSWTLLSQSRAAICSPLQSLALLTLTWWYPRVTANGWRMKVGNYMWTGWTTFEKWWLNCICMCSWTCKQFCMWLTVHESLLVKYILLQSLQILWLETSCYESRIGDSKIWLQNNSCSKSVMITQIMAMLLVMK